MAQAHSQQRATVWMNDKDVLWRMCIITNPYSYILKKREREKREKGKKEIKIIDNSYFSTRENSSYFTG